MDVGVNLLSQVRKKCKTATEVVGDMLDLPLENESFDIVLSTESIEHTADPQKAVSELCRVLKPGGSIIITCPNRLWSWTLRIAQLFKLRPYEGYENWVWWWDIRKWLSQNKIGILEMRGIHLFPPLQALNFLNPLLRVSEKLGRMGGPLYDTLAVKGQKIGSNAEPLN
jgi:SAM-dependent methyltransferase